MTLSYHFPSHPEKALLCYPPAPPTPLFFYSMGGLGSFPKDVPRVARPSARPLGHRLSPRRSQSHHQVALQLHQALLAAGLSELPSCPRPHHPPRPSLQVPLDLILWEHLEEPLRKWLVFQC